MWVNHPPGPRHLVAYVPTTRRSVPRVSTAMNTGLLGTLGISSVVTTTAGTAATGVKLGAAAGPIGMAIGGVVGAIAGVLMSVLHKQDQEIQNFNQAQQIADSQGAQAVLNIANKYLVLAGLFDLQPGQIKGNIPIYKKYGRMGEQRFVTDLMTRVYQAAQAGAITANDTAESIMARIVQPWIDSWGYGPISDHNAAMINMIIMGMILEYTAGLQTRWLARGGQNPFGTLPPFTLAAPPPAPTVAAPAARPVVPVQVVPSGPVQAVMAPAPAVNQVVNATPALPASSAQASVGGGAVSTAPATVVPVPVTAAGQVDTNSLVQQLLAQGQSQQQAYQSAMASLQAAGVPPSAQAQQAVGQAVQAQAAGFGSFFSGNAGIALTLGGLILTALFLARPAGGGAAPRSRAH